jgi:hypothetical protein
MVYEGHTTDDQVPAGRGPRGTPPGPETLPTYASKFSRRAYTQHQLFALLALKTDYRGLTAVLRDFPALRQDLGLAAVPH